MTQDQWEQIYHLYFDSVYRYLLSLSSDEEIAREITSETFFKAMQALDRFRHDCDIRIWLCQIAKNSYFTHLRKQKREVSLAERGENCAQSPQPLEEQITSADTVLSIHKILHRLDEPYKEVFFLRVFGELSFQQIADVFHKTANWACVTYHRARKKIQREMEEEE